MWISSFWVFHLCTEKIKPRIFQIYFYFNFKIMAINADFLKQGIYFIPINLVSPCRNTSNFISKIRKMAFYAGNIKIGIPNNTK